MSIDFLKILAFFSKLTWAKALLSIFGALAFIAFYTLYENRQQVYDTFAFGKYNGDFAIGMPSPVGEKLMKDLLKKHPEVAVIAIIDADPIRNLRIPVVRYFNDAVLEKVITEREAQSPYVGTGALFNDDQNNNKQMLAIMSGEFFCAPLRDGFMAQAFPGVVGKIDYTCRVPLPPAFNKATGWFSLHLRGMDINKIDALKFDALTMSVAYYNAEIAVRGQNALQ